MARAAHSGTPGTRFRALRPVAALTAVVLAASSLALAAPGARADGTDTDERTALPRTISSPHVVAASGSDLLLAVDQGGGQRFLASTDDGTSFDTISNPGLRDGEIAGARDGSLVSYVPGDVETKVYLYDFASGTTAEPITIPTAEPLAVDPTTAVFVDEDGAFQAEDLASQAMTPLAYAPPAGADVMVSLAGSTAALMTRLATGTNNRPATGTLDLVPLDGTAARTASVPGLIAATLRGEQVVYVTATGSGTTSLLKLCFLSTQLTNPSCTSAKVPGLSDQRDAWSEVFAGADWVQWSIGSASTTVDYVVAGADAPGTPIRIAVDEATTLFSGGDARRPLAVVTEGDAGYVGTVGTNASISPMFTFPKVPTTLRVLELTPDRLTGLDDRPSAVTDRYQPFERDVSETAIGAEKDTSYPSGLDIGTSGARTLVDDGAKLQLFDRGTKVRTLSRSKYGSLPGLISGPYYPAYALSYIQALRVDGKALKSATIRGMFGSLVLERTNAALGRYDVVDLAGGASVRVNVPLRYRLQGFSLAGLWGDWAYGYTFDSDSIPYTLAINYRTNTTYERYGLPVDYGDGFVAVKYADTAADGSDITGLEVWNPATGQAESMPDTDWDKVVTDGTRRLAYSTSDELVVRTLTVVPTTVPRLLGTLAPSSLNLITDDRSWPLELDTTKPLGAGTLTINNTNGDVVRTFVTPVSVDGSLRDLAWDGRDDVGVDVTPGDYTWRLVVPAADGSGNVVGVDGGSDFGDPADGTNGVGGFVHVVKTPLGSIAGATPTISGTAKVGKVLTAKPGSWTPASATLGYQWYRTTTTPAATIAIPGAQAAKYTVGPDDLGAKLSVKVTGTQKGWNPASKASKKTATVVKGTFTQAPTPTIDDPTPAVGNTLTALSSVWEPSPVTLSYRWYRVSSAGKATLVSSVSTYLVQPGDAGSRLKVRVTGSKPGYTSATKESKLTSTVAKA